MSLLGFDAIGRWALGQFPPPANTLIATVGRFIGSGQICEFADTWQPSVGTYAAYGTSVTFTGRVGWIETDTSPSSWSAQSLPGGVWTPSDMPSSTWRPE